MQKIFHKNFSKQFTDFLKSRTYSKVFILADDNTVNYCLPLVLKQIKPLRQAHIIEIFSGESSKNIETVQLVWERLTEQHADRKACLINLGGGMVCDLGGFAAGTFKRGIDFIHVPTTVLCQADAAVGGKQGIDFLNYKNQVGVFEDPAAIFVNAEFLKTLPKEQTINGFAEVVKHGLLAGGKFWKSIEVIEDLEKVSWEKIMKESIAFKLSVVKKDPREKGLRRILNFGHTVGHAYETQLMNNGTETLHGLCVAAGMIAELYLSNRVCGFPEKKMSSIVSYISDHIPQISIGDFSDDAIMELMKQDKKNLNGQIQFALLKNIGKPVYDVEVDSEMIRASLEFTRQVYSYSL